MADDWLCNNSNPVTDIHWWGSYAGYMDNVPPTDVIGFHIGIWTDVPANADQPWSHPGKMIWQWRPTMADLKQKYVGCDFHPDFMTDIDACFKYNFQIPKKQWFHQKGDVNVYWISISAIYPDDYLPQWPWGWKTRPHFYNDDAVRIFDPTAPIPGSVFRMGEPIKDRQGKSWDMAFELSTICNCLGDFNGDSMVNGADVPGFIATFNLIQGQIGYNPCGDFNGDGVVNGADVPGFIAAFNTMCP